MECNSAETVSPDIRDETIVSGGVKVTAELLEKIKLYVQKNSKSANTRLFSFFALLNAYIPESYLLMSECQQILGPPDPIDGGPPFEERMKPFTALINTAEPKPDQRCMIDPVTAQSIVKLLAELVISLGNKYRPIKLSFSRSYIVKNFMSSLSVDQLQPDIIQYIKDLLTKREMGDNGKEKFSRLITDILNKEKRHHAVSVLTTASNKFKQNPNFPQTLSRLYYMNDDPEYEEAEKWAKEAIKRAPKNSYMADTLGQIYKSRLMKAQKKEDVTARAKKAFGAFKDVEEKAEKEDGPEMKDIAGAVSISNTFNNRGRFGFIQVAKIALEKFPSSEKPTLIQNKKMKVEANFDFFEWYLTYSKPDVKTLEPHYFWKDVALCYKYYTKKTAAESTSFAGLLDWLNHGLFMSKGRRARLEEEKVKELSDFEEIQVVLKTTYKENVDNVEVAERLILSNIILSNKMPDSPHVTLMTELQAIIYHFLGTEVGRRSPEFYLLVLLLFWPDERTEVVQEQNDDEVEQQPTEEDGLKDNTWEDKCSDTEQETGGEATQPPLDLEQYVTLMEEAFKRAKYAKYLRGRYLLPLFFLGKGSGLSKWIHKSKLDAIVEKKVNAEQIAVHYKKKFRQINEMWIKGEVWQIPEIKDILLPVAVEPCHSPTSTQEPKEQEVFVCAGRYKIKATTEGEADASAHSPRLCYLGFTIRGPVVFKV